MNLGGFGIGFTQGLNNGLSIGEKINNLMKQDKIEQVRAKGMEEAKAARENDLSGMIKDNGIGASASEPPKAAGTRAGEVAPDTAEVQTMAVPTPPAAVSSPQAAIDAAPAQPAGAPAEPMMKAPTAPTIMPPAPEPVPVGAAVPDATGTTNPAAAGITPPTMPTRKRFSVGDASFDTVDEARAHADKTAPSVTDYFMKNAVPQISQAYLEQGDPEKAEAWEKYAKDKKTQKNMETWAAMARSAQSGNMEKAADHAFELYKAYDDGVTPVSKEVVKDKDGNVTGFNVKLKDDATGEVRSQFVGQREIVEMGLSALSPPAMFEQMQRRQQAVDAARIKTAAAAAEDQRKLQRDVTVQGMKNEAAMERTKQQGEQRLEQVSVEQGIKDASIGKAEKAKVNAKVEALRGAGYDEDTIKGMLPAMLGAGDHKKTTDPTERRALIFSDLSKNDPKFARSTPEEQNAKVEAAMQVIYSGGKAQAAPTPPAAAQPSAPAPAAPQARGVPVYDTKTGKTVLMDPVTRKPIQ